MLDSYKDRIDSAVDTVDELLDVLQRRHEQDIGQSMIAASILFVTLHKATMCPIDANSLYDFFSNMVTIHRGSNETH
jgi:uncharacterized membrane protein YkgB